MRLEKIVLSGFKSFADKTELAFNSSITAIVGPNGCGKSNVVDAVKWVLGEQSVKSLRSGQMADVIFSGSSTKKAAGSAEVTLAISNTEGVSTQRLPIDADNVEISRRIFKSGESEYRINNKICRLKDIRELFMDTGVATRAYSIIEQGQIGQLLTASKVDRRTIFEEAAGISKYKAHKKEAMRKLDRTEQNLLRLADILGEVQKQLRSVKLAAGKARNYLQYRDQLKDLQVKYSLSEYHKITTRNKEKTHLLEQLQTNFAEIAAAIARDDTAMSQLSEQRTATESELSNISNSLISTQATIEQNLQRIEFLKSRITELKQRQQDVNVRIENQQLQSKNFETDLEKYKKDLAHALKEFDQKQTEAEQLRKVTTQITAKCLALETNLEDEKSGIIDVVRRTAQLHNEVQNISIHRDSLSGQKNRLNTRAENCRNELEQLLTEKAQYQARLADIEKVLSELNNRLETKRKATTELENQIASKRNRLLHNKEARIALNSELSILSDMQARREGLNDTVKNILDKHCEENEQFDFVEALLADIVTSDVEYAAAVEAALEGITDAIVINNTEKLLTTTELLEKTRGRVKFISINENRPFSDNLDLSAFSSVKGRLVEFVKHDSKYAPLVWKLLGRVIVVETIEEAVKLSLQFGEKYSFVTLKGQFLCSDGTIKLGPLGTAAGLISRRSRLQQLRQNSANITADIAALETEIDKYSQEKTHLNQLCQDLRTAVYEANTETTQLNSKLTVYEQNIKKLTQEQPLITGEMEMLEEQIVQAVKRQYESKQKLDELETVNQQRQDRIKELETNYTQEKLQQQQHTDKLTELKITLGQLTEQKLAIEKTIESLQTQLQTSRSATKTAEEEIANCLQNYQSLQDDILKAETVISQLYAEKDQQEGLSETLNKKIKQLIEQQQQLEETIKQQRSRENNAQEKINELKIELSQLAVKLQDLIERVNDELGIDLAKSYQNYQDEQVDWQAVRENIAELRGKIERLGNVNLDAIAQQENLEERNNFLSDQVQDLNKSKNQLQQLIIRLNKVSREKFIETFEEIRVNFQAVFRKLFGGGKADILLEDTEDILDAGIEIIARPPGKETRSISLLSGGEKAMTAIALLFAVFKSKPSPFCFLDEVDAALDEANNERFNMLIQEFQKQSQFIVITHAKRTMSIADQLYGITMQTRGVSKKISVKFGDFEDKKDRETAAVA